MGKDQELLEAARCGQVATIEKILCPPKSKWTNPLTLPLVQFTQLASSTLRKNVNPNCQDGNGETPLHLAALNGHIDVVAALLKQQASANIADSRGCFPLHLAAWRGDAEMCRTLLTHGPSISNVDEVNLEGETALHSAAQYGHTEVVNILLQNRADPRVMSKKKERALDLAIHYGRLEAVQLLLCSVGESTTVRAGDKSPLHLAAKNGHRNVVEALLDAGFDINHRLDSGSALHEAVSYGRLDIVKLLLERDIDIHARTDTDKTALDLLAEQDTQISRDIHLVISKHIKGEDDRGRNSSLEAENEYVNVSTIRAQNNNDSSLAYHLDRFVSESDSVFDDNLSPSNERLAGEEQEEEQEEEILYDRLPTTRPVLIVPDDEEPSTFVKTVPKDCRPLTCIDAPKKPPRKKPHPETTPVNVDTSSVEKRSTVVNCVVSIVVSDCDHPPPAAPDTECEKSDSKVHPSLPAVIVNESHSSPTSDIAGGKSDGRNSKEMKSCHPPGDVLVIPTAVVIPTALEPAVTERFASGNVNISDTLLPSTAEMTGERLANENAREACPATEEECPGARVELNPSVESTQHPSRDTHGSTQLSKNNDMEKDCLDSGAHVQTHSQPVTSNRFSGLRHGSIQRAQRQCNSMLLRKVHTATATDASKRISVPSKMTFQPIVEQFGENNQIYFEPGTGPSSPPVETIVLISSIEADGRECIKRHVSVRKASVQEDEYRVCPRNGADKELEEEHSTQPPSVGNLHQQELGVLACKNFNVKYVGSTPVTSIDGAESTRESICKLRKSTSTVPSITLSISHNGVQFIEQESQKVICIHDIGNIFSASQDRESLDHLAYITSVAGGGASTRHYCHVFSAASAERVREIMRALGQAFDTVYQITRQENETPASSQ